MGVNSTALMLFLIDQGIEFESVFINHRGDFSETYEYHKYLEGKGYEFTVIDPEVSWKGKWNDIYEYFWNFKSIPLVQYRICTDKFKIRPFYRYIEKPATVYIGYSSDERNRVMKHKPRRKVKTEYPFLENQISRQMCKDIIRKHGLKVPPPSRCYICPFHQKSEWKRIMVTHPEEFKKAMELEKNTARNLTLMPRGPALSALWQENKLTEYLD